MHRDASNPKDYLAQLEGDQLVIVKALRKAIRRAVPKIEERIRNGMLDYPGLANVGAQMRYVALYVAPDVLKRHRKAFPGVDAGKSCLRFARSAQLDHEALVALLVDVHAYRRAKGD